MKAPKIDNEFVEKVREFLKGLCVNDCVFAPAFEWAYEKGKGMDYQRHRVYIVPTALINNRIGCDEYYTDPAYAEAFRRMGCKRSTRLVKSKGVYVGVWSIPYKVVGK